MPSAAPSPHPGSLTDVAGLAVGHFTHPRRPTGCSVVLCPEGAVGGVEVRGGAPGTRETDLLAPGRFVEQVHAVLLTGGSAFGLDAAGGVMRWLEQHGHGLPVGPGLRVPIVPAAVLFDLWLGDASIRPDAAAGHAACEAASTAPVTQGSVGAGAGASVGKLYGFEHAMRGGLGSASVKVAGVTVAAMIAVNAVGDVLDEQGRVLAGALDDEDRRMLDCSRSLAAGRLPATLLAGTATTIGVVATDAKLDKTQASRLAALAHHGLSRAISPLTQFDGDTLFTLATGRAGFRAELSLLGALAADVVAAAIRNAVRAASPLERPPLPCVRSLRAGPRPPSAP